MRLVVLLVEHGLNLADVALVHFQGVEFAGVQILNYNLRLVVLGSVDSDEVLEAVELRDDEGLIIPGDQQILPLLHPGVVVEVNMLILKDLELEVLGAGVIVRDN